MDAADVQALALAERVVHEPLVLADRFPVRRLHRSWIGREIACEELPERPFADEADTGRVFLVVNVEPPVPGNSPHVVFEQLAEGEDGFGESLGADGVQEVALVLVRVLALVESTVAIDDSGSRVMTRCQQVTAKSFCVVAEDAELDLPVAQDIGIRRPAFAVFVEEILEHLVTILLRDIDMV